MGSDKCKKMIDFLNYEIESLNADKEKLKALLLEKCSLANIEPVFTDENGNEYTIDNESALKVLNDILEQAFIPFVAEQVINAGYGNVKQAVKKYKEGLKERLVGSVADWVLSYLDNFFKEIYGEE